MSTKNYQMFWDCGHCGTKKLLGVSHRHCPNCGAAQDETKRYFPPDGEEVELHNHIYYGIDWDCAYCSTPNSKNSHNCVNCGGGKDGTKNVKLVGEPYQEETTSYQTSTSTPQEKLEIKRTVLYERPSTPVKEKNSSSLWIILGVSLFALFIGFLIYGFNSKTDHTLTVASKTWSRSIDIEEYRAIHDTDWCSSMPSDGYNVSSFRDVRSHRDVADGQECHTEKRDRGDGSYSSQRVCHTKYRREPVYDNRCSYTVNRWRFSNSVLARGDDKTTPYDPDVSMYRNYSQHLGSKRVGSKSESYNIDFFYVDSNKNKMASCSYSQQRWNNFNVNSQHHGQVRMIGGLICNEITNIQPPTQLANTN